jgi:hypothetical protein
MYKVTRRKKDADQKEDQGHSARDDEFSAGVPGEVLIAVLAPIAFFPSFNKLRISSVLVALIDVFSPVFAATAFHNQLRGLVMFPSHLPEFLVSPRRSIGCVTCKWAHHRRVAKTEVKKRISRML